MKTRETSAPMRMLFDGWKIVAVRSMAEARRRAKRLDVLYFELQVWNWRTETWSTIRVIELG